MDGKTALSSASSEYAGFTPEISQSPSIVSDKRSLILSYGAVEAGIELPASQYGYGGQQWKDFSSDLGKYTPENDLSTKEGLVAEFIAFCLKSSEDEGLEFLRSLLESFEQEILGGNDIHAALYHANTPQKKDLIKTYFAARERLGSTPQPQPSLLLQSAEKDASRIYMLFGGQGNDENYFNDLKDVYSTYPDLLRSWVFSGSRVLEDLAEKPAFKGHLSRGFSLIAWLEKPESEPNSSYLLAAPVSMPLIGLLQICHFIVACQTMGLTPQEFHRYLAGVTGHSQGIVTAIVISISTTWESFHRHACDALRILFYIACRSHQAYPPQCVPESIRHDTEEHHEGTPSPMLRVRNIGQQQLQQIINTVNSHLPRNAHMAISLINGPQNLIVVGPTMSLYGLSRHLRTLKASKVNQEARIPARKRKPKIDHRFLPITAPFHSDILKDVTALVMQDLEGLSVTGDQLQLPVFATTDGHDMREFPDCNVVPEIIHMVAKEPVHWEKATAFAGATHIIDFGPGGNAGVGFVTVHNKAGLGARLILGGSMKTSDEYGNKADLFNRNPQYPVLCAENWAAEYKPRLTRDPTTKQVQVQTKFTKLLGLPPIMVAGMTPTTVPWDFISATMNAGYHIELAGGGYYNRHDLEEAIAKIVHNGIPGRGVTCNIIYANPSSVRWQIALLKDLRSSGVPIDGITIGAGVPSVDVANEYIQTLGLKHISFKPGSVEAIQQVIDIAQENKSFPIILQWTGGRGGGHHSYEDFHEPILQMYGRIRAYKNIVLVAGSGFGGAEDTLPYLTGEWSKAYSASSPMPFDGILMGSRIMGVKEAHTSIEAKQLIVDTPGVDDASWDQTYSRPAGGVITVQSEMGEPIHKIATRGVLLWAEMDRTVFSIADKTARVAFLKKNKGRIINNLNNDFQKVWFGCDENGKACELNNMTLSGVIRRMVDLLFIKHQARWIHRSLQQLTYDFLVWIEDIVSESREVSNPRFWQSVDQIDEPFQAIEQFLVNSPKANFQLMDTVSTQMFLHLCRRRGQKPVPFIPVLDEDFEVWFKKDSLWQSEDVQAVPGQDVGRTCILHSPVAAKHTHVVNESIKGLLDTIHDQWAKCLLEKGYKSHESLVPSIDLGDSEEEISSYMSTEISMTKTYNPTAYGDELPSLECWMGVLAGGQNGWRHAIFTQKTIVQDYGVCANPLQRLFAPRPDIYVEIEEGRSGEYCVILLFEKSSQIPVVEVRRAESVDRELISVSLIESRTVNRTPARLELLFSHHSEFPFAPIREVLPGKVDRVKEFYHQLWFGESLRSLQDSEFYEDTMTVTREDIKTFRQCVGSIPGALTNSQLKISAPMDFAIVVAWKSVMKPLFAKRISGNLLKLVHLSNQFRRLESSAPIQEGDLLSSRAHIRAILNEDSGKVVEVVSVISRGGTHADKIMELVSRFMYRGTYNDHENTFQQSKEPIYELQLSGASDVAILLAKPWFNPINPDLNLRGCKLTFDLETHTRFQSPSVYHQLRCFGAVHARTPIGERLEVAYIDHMVDVANSSPVVDYLKRHATLVNQPVLFESPITLGGGEIQFQSPLSNEAYASVSGDFNPIHVSRIFADYAELPDTITHGMYMSAKIRSLLEQLTVCDDTRGHQRYQCTFVGMVVPEDEVEVVFHHVGMVNGRKLIRAEACRAGTAEKLLVVEAEIEQPSTAFLFTGQGSQEKGMGMDLYATSPAARKVWDLADQHFLDKFGFRITDIVRNDPKELKIYFGGLRGRTIRENYMGLRCEMIHADGGVTSERIFKEIDETSRSYTFRSSLGLLSSTQFTQPALTLMEKAIIEDMRAKGLVSDHCSFAGHSLGEYSALTAIAEIMPIESLVSVVFYRGLTMQMAVERDEQGRSNFSMCAVDPSRLAKTFDEEGLRYLVALIASETGWLLEIVNHNVANSQYVCAGDLRALDCLSAVMGEVKQRPQDFQDVLQAERPLDEIRDCVLSTVRQCASGIRAKPLPIELQRGVATVPLRGIDVPFHSSFLAPGIAAFRACLHQYIDKDKLDADKLVGKYIPNLTARPFDVSEEYFRDVFRLTKSPIIAKILSRWNEYTELEKISDGIQIIGPV
ncbi:uncharacterized protein ATNIH1004_011590 [Aspergillus tanneri]|nr:uncharacterized protein ATNIH1004_011590 [Aspergillus tanneri]KAA8642645.1 hypothetical protein ATNIH1004_011590 [Aspergillus tanneri]